MAEESLLPPLWELTASYLDAAERWFYRDVSCLRISAKEPFDYLKILEAAVRGNHLHMIPQMNNFDFIEWSESTILTIIGLDRLEFLQWFDAEHSELFRSLYSQSRFFHASARAGAIRIFKWEVQRCLVLCTDDLAKVLVEADNIQALSWLGDFNRGCLIYAMEAAVLMEKKEIIAWFARKYHHEASFLRMTIRQLPPLRTLDMLHLMIEAFDLVRYPAILRKLFMDASVVGSLEMVKHLVEMELPAPADLRKAMIAACAPLNTSPAKAEYLLGRGAPLPPWEPLAAPAVKTWLIAHGCSES